MIFNGFQKLTLLDFPGHTACTLFTSGCNFRCPFCHNALLVTRTGENGESYGEEEILAFLKKRKGLLDGICVTGGEPLLQKGLPDFLRRVKALGFAVKLDTNGSKPAELKALVKEKLVDYVAMDIKNCREKYGLTVGLRDFDPSPVEESIDFLLSGAVPYEFRTTVVAEFHTAEDIEKIAERIKKAPCYFLQNFVDSGDLIGDNLHAVSRETLEKMKEIASKRLSSTVLRGV